MGTGLTVFSCLISIFSSLVFGFLLDLSFSVLSLLLRLDRGGFFSSAPALSSADIGDIGVGIRPGAPGEPPGEEELEL